MYLLPFLPFPSGWTTSSAEAVRQLRPNVQPCSGLSVIAEHLVINKRNVDIAQILFWHQLQKTTSQILWKLGYLKRSMSVYCQFGPVLLCCMPFWHVELVWC